MNSLKGYNLTDILDEAEGQMRPVKRRVFVPRRQTAKTAVSAARAALIANTRLVASARPRLSTGVNSSSVYQPPRGRELKSFDQTNTQSPAIAGTGTLSIGLLLPAQGTALNNRVGTELTVRSLEWRQTCSLATTTGGGSIRTVIVYDKAPNGAAPTIATGAVSDIFNQDAITAQMNLANRDRFIVIQDILVESLGTAGPQANYQKGYRTVSLPQVYNGSSGAVAALNTGNFVAVTWCSPGFATAPPTVTLQTRLRYDDA